MHGTRIGWIGLGRMGLPMAQRVRAAGWSLSVWARRSDTTAPLRDAGAAVAATPEDLARGCACVVTMVGGPADVDALHAVLMPAATPGTLFIDMSTAAPATAEAAQDRAARHGHTALDAPVTGGVAGAQRGTLMAFVGGEATALERARPLLEVLCQRLVPCGAAGSGYRTKLVNQTLMAGALMGVADGLRLARAAGLEADFLRQALAGGTGASTILDAYLPRMLSGDGPVSFTLALLRKDLRLARDEAAALGLPAPLLDAALAAVDGAIARHGAEAGLQVLAR